MIQDYGFGKITVDGETYSNDIKIIDGRVVPEWWRDEGHRITLEDIQDILDKAPDILVVGTGYYGNMKSTDTFRTGVKDRGIELIEEKSGQAVKTFNQLREEGKDVAAGFHLTC
ncbi:MAG: Mth938-like domain-containing protein [Thermodesulfobacteriota bacterium]